MRDYFYAFQRALNHTLSRSGSDLIHMLFSLEFRDTRLQCFGPPLLVLSTSWRPYVRINLRSQQILCYILPSIPIFLKCITGFFLISRRAQPNCSLIQAPQAGKDLPWYSLLQQCHTRRIQQNLAEFLYNHVQANSPLAFLPPFLLLTGVGKIYRCQLP